jgi:alternate signal-mediated exported protein
MTASTSSTPTTRPTGRSKGIVAIVAGTALLLGGTGTYAYWSTQQALTPDDIVTGDLDLTVGTGTWTLDGVVGPALPVTTPADVRIVPGDVLVLDQAFDVVLVGDTIEALLTVDTTGVIPAGAEANFTVDLETTGVGTEVSPNVYRLTPDDAGDDLEATLTITFNGPLTTGTQFTETTLNLSALQFSLEQATS